MINYGLKLNEYGVQMLGVKVMMEELFGMYLMYDDCLLARH